MVSLEELILKYLKNNYVIRRIKINNKFKRAISVGSKTFLLSKTNREQSKQEIAKQVSIIFDVEEQFSNGLVNYFLQ